MQKWEYCRLHHYQITDKKSLPDENHFELDFVHNKITIDYAPNYFTQEEATKKTKEIQENLPGFDSSKIFIKENNGYKIENLQLEILDYLGKLGWEMAGVIFGVIYFKRQIDA